MGGQSCVICQKDASKRCGGCCQVYYCNKEHQKLDWAKHKHTCKPFKVCEDPVLGRHLVATRDITAGEVILKEPPLLQGPSQVTGPVCLSCLQAVSQHNSEPCSQCGWPLCLKPKCRESKQHLPECRWTMDKRKNPVKISQFITPHPSYECITTLRLCYAKRHSPGLWGRLCKLQSHTEERRGTHKYKEDTRTVAQFLRRFYKLEDEFSDEDIMDIWGIIQVNGHEVPLTQPAHVAVYDLSSMLEHSCHPNCAKSFASDASLVLRAVVKVSAGQHLSICYTDCLWGTVNRQYHLRDTKFFTCQCPRCLDPTEMGTYFSAILCEKSDCSGTMLPASLCSLVEATPWTCDSCGHVVYDSQVEATLQQAGQELATLQSKNLTESTKFLEKWRSKFHQNHFYLTEVRLAIAERMGQESPQGIRGLSPECLQYKVNLTRDLLELLSLIAPGETRVLGMLNFGLHACLAERARRDHLQGHDQFYSALMESLECLDKTIFFLAVEPEVLPEGKLLLQAKQNKAELLNTLQNIQMCASMASPM
ncbi:SET domain-containing protein SmydA-8-like [Macrosteles quadrilineatus]|uniref:SET domain-containing protein SmydA-8-like n=1 Tax=Macrosteles quadrilineatus TaxID=74068 RepID=UPI0023E2B187|nr:SET domain-containing protein SmydA-8-like [Macrosteles quadrilineatus]XP_054269408.1 SET domain-containing protein SmydA-8-like [Macrosteles quadrilineatus]